jgi:Protein of unknown function (DUF3800)
MTNFSDYIVYADESGDHNLVSINPQNPVFVLVFCIFKKSDYSSQAVPAIQQLKFDYWGHDSIVLHGHDIRKRTGDFNILLNSNRREPFLARISSIVEAMPMTIVAAAIDKSRHVKQYTDPANPYAMALTFCMERLQWWLKDQKAIGGTTHVVVEKRGKAEDQLLELEFRRISDGQNALGKMPNLDIRFMDKKHNSTGLQIADLVAHPIARHVINPKQSNRGFEIVKSKLRTGNGGKIQGYGLKVFP